MNDQAVDAVARSIQEFGFRQPIVVDDEGVIIVGHTRYKASLKLGLKKVPVHVAQDLSPEQIKAYRLADNKTHELSDWDDELLSQELAELAAADFDLTLMGFGQDELVGLSSFTNDAAARKLRSGRGNAAFDMARGKTKVGAEHHQKFDLARHPEKAQATHRKMRAKDRPLAGDFVSDEEFDRLLHAWFGNIARVLLPGRAFYLWGGYSNIGNYPPVLKVCGLYFSQTIIWHKSHPVLTRKDRMGSRVERVGFAWGRGKVEGR